MTDDVFYRISTIMNVDPAEIAKIVHDYIESDIGCGTVYDRLNCPKPPIYIGPVKVKSLKERLEEIKMNATSVQVINNVKDMNVTIERGPLEETRIIISINTDDDTYEINCSGPGCLEFLRKGDFVSIQEYDYIHSQLMEREKEVRELKQQLQDAGRDKKSLRDRYEFLDRCYKGLLKDNKNLIKCKDSLKSDLDLERAANEAQRKFIKEYAGNDTEVTFNYAISSGPITYGLYDKDYVDELRKKNNNLIAENAELKAKLCYKAKSANDIKKLKEQIKKDEEPSSRRDILKAAEKCVCGQREQDYGTPESNFQLIADLWNDYLGITDYVLNMEQRFMDLNEKGIKVDVDFPKPKTIFPEDVSMMMALLKIARIRNGGGSGDSFVDLAGYAACGGEIWASKRYQKYQN